MMTFRKILMVLVFWGFLPQGALHAQNINDLQDAIKELRREFQDLQKLTLGQSPDDTTINRVGDRLASQVYEQIQAIDARMGELSANLFTKVGDSENTLLDLSGRLETLEGQIQKSEQTFTKYGKDAEFRFQSLQDDLKALKDLVAKAEKVAQLAKQFTALSEQTTAHKTMLTTQQALVDSQTETINEQGKVVQDLLSKLNQVTQENAQLKQELTQQQQKIDQLNAKISGDIATIKQQQAIFAGQQQLMAQMIGKTFNSQSARGNDKSLSGVNQSDSVAQKSDASTPQKETQNPIEEKTDKKASLDSSTTEALNKPEKTTSPTGEKSVQPVKTDGASSEQSVGDGNASTKAEKPKAQNESPAESPAESPTQSSAQPQAESSGADGVDSKQISQKLTLDSDKVKEQALKKVTQEQEKPTPQFASATEHYKTAIDLMGQEKFKEAEDLFRAFIKIYPNDESVDDAKYFLAGILVDRGESAEGGKLYLDIYSSHSNSNRLSGSLLKLARLYKDGDRIDVACQVLGVLTDSYKDKQYGVTVQRDLRTAESLRFDYKCS